MSFHFILELSQKSTKALFFYPPPIKTGAGSWLCGLIGRKHSFNTVTNQLITALAPLPYGIGFFLLAGLTQKYSAAPNPTSALTVVPNAWFCAHGSFLLSYCVKNILCQISSFLSCFIQFIKEEYSVNREQGTVWSKAQGEGKLRGLKGNWWDRVDDRVCLATESGGGGRELCQEIRWE